MRFHLDEHIAHAIASGLRRRSIDVTTSSDAGLLGADDREHVEYARREGRIIVTDDTDFLALADAGVAHPGIVYCRRATHTLGQIIEHLVLIDACLTEEEMANHVEHF